MIENEGRNGSGISIEMIKEDADRMLAQHTDDTADTEWKSVGLLKHNTANNALKEAMNMPKREMLFDEFWFEGEVCILFADTNVGKSILAVQIGDSICCKIQMPLLPL
jgi:hypothetical protein